MSARTITVESQTEITVDTIGQAPTGEQVMRATMRLAPQQVFVGELSNDPQRDAEFLASVEAQCNKSE